MNGPTRYRWSRRGRTRLQTVSKPSTEGFTLFPAPTRPHGNSASPFLGRCCPHDHTAPKYILAKGGQQSRHRDEVQHSPEIVRQYRQTKLCPHLLQSSHEEITRLPPPFHRSKRVFHQLLALPHHLRPAAHALLHGLQQVLIDPPGNPSSPFTACALQLERTATAG